MSGSAFTAEQMADLKKAVELEEEFTRLVDEIDGLHNEMKGLSPAQQMLGLGRPFNDASNELKRQATDVAKAHNALMLPFLGDVPQVPAWQQYASSYRRMALVAGVYQ